MNKNSRLVYSTESGRITTDEDNKNTVLDEGDGIVRLFRESRKGKGVTLIKGLPLSVDAKALAKTLKKKLGVGGSYKNGVIEIQSDQRESLKDWLEKEGYRVKIAGG